MATKKAAPRGGPPTGAATLCAVCGQTAHLCMKDYDQTLNAETGGLESDGPKAVHWYCRDHADEYCEARLLPGTTLPTRVVPRWQAAPKLDPGIELLDVFDREVSVDMTGSWKGEGVHVAFYGSEGDEQPQVTHLVITLPVRNGKLPKVKHEV